MDLRDSYLGKRSLSELEAMNQQKLDEDDAPVKKKLRTKLVDLFNRASISMQTPDDYIKVYLRIKPFTAEEDSSQRCYTVTEENNTIVATAPELSHAFRNTKRGMGSSSHKFTFSRIFNENTSQGDFFNATMLSMTKDFISGQNSLVFTYGVTSSGKTYTIQGQPQNAGILPRCLDVLFNSINGKQIPSTTALKPRMFTDVIKLSPTEVALERKLKERTLKMSIDDDTTVMTLLGDEMESALSDTATSSSSACGEDLFSDVEKRDREKLKVEVEDQGKIRFGVWVSFAEIYNEQIFDLLEPFPRKKGAKRIALKICDDRNGNPYIKGLKEIHVESADEAYRLLTIGQRNLQTACTRLNHCSSRSHCMFNIKIVRVVDKDDPHIARVSMLSLCDLAGSERYSKTQATGDRLKEAGNINASLMTLGRCIETLRYNQLHRDQQRLVPFRDSKLTRLLQNYFNGSGRAVMIVNVSQSSSMFDDTLHVFKFSAIAKQVKYIEKPPEPPKKLKEKKIPPPLQRPSIEWEVQATTENAILKDAQNKPLPDDDDVEDDSVEDVQDEIVSENYGDVNEMITYIKTLELRNERLVEMIQEEMEASSNIEMRVRKEVTEAMMKQVVNIEDTYSALLRETREETEELADERVRGIMAVYEGRLERIQRKVDEDDEWVSSLLYHQEQLKVEQRDAVIADLEKQIEKIKEAASQVRNKDEKIEELESLITEAGEVYNKHMAEIAKLTEENKKAESQLCTLRNLEIQLNEVATNYSSLQQTLKSKEAEWKAIEEKLNKKIESKDTTITSLQDECKELQDEIERLQDQMSQMDENSKYRIELETSTASDNKEAGYSNSNSLKHADKSTECVQEIPKKTVREHGTQCSEGDFFTGESYEEILNKVARLKEEVAKKDKETEAVNAVNEELKEQIKCLQGKIDDLVKEISVKDKLECISSEEKLSLQKTIEQLTKSIDSVKQSEMSTNEKLLSSHQQNSQIKSELEYLKKVYEDLIKEVDVLKSEQKLSTAGMDTCNEQISTPSTEDSLKHDKAQIVNEETVDHSIDNEIVLNVQTIDATQESLKLENDALKKEHINLQTANAALKEKVQKLEEQLNKTDFIEEHEDTAGKDVNISEMVRHLEQKNTPFPKSISGKCQSNNTCLSNATEVVLNEKGNLGLKTEIDNEVLQTPSARSSQNSKTTTLAVKLKDAELANAALRNKLKKEEDDYFRREQALIHGYTAEIDSLKYELAKYKSKVDGPARMLPQRGKRKAVDTSISSLMSDCVSEINVADVNDVNMKVDDIVREKQSVICLSGELLSTQEQLLSLTAAYRKLQGTESKSTTNSFIKDVVLGTQRGHESTHGIFRLEDNVADSVLQFELDEFAVRMDEMRIKISQQENEIMLSKTAFERAKAEKLKVEARLNEMLQKQKSPQTDEENMTLETTENEQMSKGLIEHKLQESLAANSQLQSEIVNQKAMIAQLEENLKTEQAAKNETELKLMEVSAELTLRNDEVNRSAGELSKLQKTIEDLSSERDNLLESITSLREDQNIEGNNVQKVNQELTEAHELLKGMENELESLKEELKTQAKLNEEAEAKLAEVLAEKCMLEKSLKSTSEYLDVCKAKLTDLELNYSDIKVKLEKTLSVKIDLENKLKCAQEKQTAEEDMMKLKEQLRNKTEELEKVEHQRQEESAEVSQKLLMLEREKKLAERKVADAKEKELEWQLKCQGLDHMKQLEQQLHQQLKSAAECVRKHSMKTSELTKELVSTKKEMEQLKVELASMESHNKITEELKSKIKELEEAVASEKKQRSQTEKSLQESQEKVANLISSIKECEETMDKQDIIINNQDGDLDSMKTKIDVLTSENKRLDELLKTKELEITTLNQQLSKLTADIALLRQTEQKVSDAENTYHDQLQKVMSENSELENRLQKVEKENINLEKKWNSSEQQVKNERENIEHLEEMLARTEKHKKDLEKEIESLVEKQKIADEQMEKVNRQLQKELEQSSTLKAEVKLLKKETEEGIKEKDKDNSNLERENNSLKEEMSKLSQDIISKQNDLDKLQETLKETTESLKIQEKELKKQERINKRNREEMENWKKERDVCVSRIEEHLNLRQQECRDLGREVERLKKDNAELVKTVTNVTNMKDSVIADLRKQNNILSTQMAQAQGMSPPPKIATPDNSVFHRNEFIEDLDTTGHLEIDATPPIAAKKCRKRQSRQTHSSCSSSSFVESEVLTTPICKSLKPIEELNENSPSSTRTTSPTKNNLGRVAELASGVIASISPLTRSARKREKNGKNNKTLTISAPFDLVPHTTTENDVQNENDNPMRRSSRLRTRSKHTAI